MFSTFKMPYAKETQNTDFLKVLCMSKTFTVSIKHSNTTIKPYTSVWYGITTLHWLTYSTSFRTMDSEQSLQLLP